MNRSYVLGIDTSNYTTSVAVADESGQIIANLKRPLPVAEGACGLRQSDALFAHVKNLPFLMQELRTVLEGKHPVAVGVSGKPRNQEGSYMPCFLAGVAAAESAAGALSVPLYTFSHQCGHLRAAMYSAKKAELLAAPFGAFHVSGGTTEMLLAKPASLGFAVDLLGGTADLNAGQAIDRVGVMMGLAFPCGPALEALARDYIEKNGEKSVPKRKIKVENGEIHLSGLENMAERLYRETNDASYTAAFVLSYIASALSALTQYLRKEKGDALPILFSGGVMSNRIIQQKLKQNFENVFFAEPAFSADNAAGIALLALEAYKREQAL